MSLNINEYIEKINEELAKEGDGFEVAQIILENTNSIQPEALSRCRKWGLVYDRVTRTWVRKCVG